MKALGRLFIGISLLMVLAIVPVLFLGTSWPMGGIVGSLLCGSDKFLSETSKTLTQIGNSNLARVNIGTTAACVNETTGEQSDALTKFLLFATVAFIIPFMIGMTFNSIGSVMSHAGGNLGEMRAIANMPDVKAKGKEWQAAVRSGQMSVEEYSERVKELYAQKAAERAAANPPTNL
jgi:hypothetical protein